MSLDSNIKIRPMEENEKDIVKKLHKDAFSLIEHCFFSFSPYILVAEYEGKLIGGLTLKIFTILKKKKKIGVYHWLFTFPGARGLGAAQKLVEEGKRFFKEQGCDETLAQISGYNPSSFKNFYNRGFDIIPFAQQVRRWKFPGLISVWVRTNHIFGNGNFLWGSPKPNKKDKPIVQWVAMIILNFILYFITKVRWRGFGHITPLYIAFTLAATIIVYGLRILMMLIVTRAQGLKMQFRAWGGGYPLSILISVAFGGPYPVPGSIYPKDHNWSHQKLKKKLGVMGLIGCISILTLIWISVYLITFSLVPAEYFQFLDMIVELSMYLIIFEILIPIFPFDVYNGRRVYNWSKPLWMILAVFAIFTFVFVLIF